MNLYFNLSVANGTINEIENLDLVMDTRLSSFLICYVIYTLTNPSVHWITYNLLQLRVPNVYAINNGNFHLDNSSLKTVFPMFDANYRFITDGQQIVENLDRFMTNQNIRCSCSSEYGNVCVLTESTKKFANYTLFTTYQINFLSSGSVINFQTLNNSTINNTINTDLQFKIQPSFYGGSIITSWASLPPDSSTNDDYMNKK
ncbi:9296_t:CDS:2 [Gigaspora margarita]|uniref:9296_t:CDS:1 n=1 Tax=Gigaspora margarita TaxID=4874 RepID=A0ABN7UL74_GIGMA|nr:9296_t:CDS:2 [Gigaspora margarita]